MLRVSVETNFSKAKVMSELKFCGPTFNNVAIRIFCRILDNILVMSNRIRQMLLFVAAIGPVISVAHAQTDSLCPSVMAAKYEGAMPIPEKSFTEQAAKRELQKLNKLLGPEGLAVDPVAWETSFVFIEGWYLKRQALEAKKRNETDVVISDFCTFMKERAYIHH